MRSMLFMVLALWLFCKSRGYGKQGMDVQGILPLDAAHRREEPSMLSLEVSDGMVSPNKPTRHIVPRLSHDSGSGAKGVIPSDIAEWTAASKQSLLLDEDVVRMLSHDTERGRQGPMSFVETALDNKVNVSKYVVERMLLHDSNVPVSLHDKVGQGQSHTLLLQVVEGTSADKQAGSGQHFYVHTSSLQDRHAIRMLSDAARLGAEGHTSQLDVIAETASGEQANAVRRQGVDSALLKYSSLTLSADLRTGVIYDVGLPPSLAGIRAQVVRLNAATFKQDGLIFNEFTLPPGASFDPTSTFVAIVYRKILTFEVYNLPPRYQFGGPVIGIISSPSNVTSLDPSLPQANISLSPNTVINISLPMFSSNPNQNALCAFMASNGSIFVSNLASLPNICMYSTLGDFALVVQASSTTSPMQNPPPPPVATASPLTNVNGPSSSSTASKSTRNWKLVVGATCLALAGLAFLVALALISIKLADSFKLFFTTRFTGNEEALQNSLIGNSKAPTAGVMRTKPALEIDMAHFTNQLVA